MQGYCLVFSRLSRLVSSCPVSSCQVLSLFWILPVLEVVLYSFSHYSLAPYRESSAFPINYIL